MASPPGVLMMVTPPMVLVYYRYMIHLWHVTYQGTGEYTTGFTGEGAAKSDKPTGVVGLVMLDLRAQGRIGRIGMCGTNGRKLPAVREHLKTVLGDVYDGIDPSVSALSPPALSLSCCRTSNSRSCCDWLCDRSSRRGPPTT